MDIKELIQQLDDMEASTGLNITESTIEDNFLKNGKHVKSDLLGLGIGFNMQKDGDLYFGGISYGPTVKSFSTIDYAGDDLQKDLANVIKKCLDNLEKDIKDLLGLI